ncbi:hypothetical protein LQK89_17885 (plasmid) [Curtobacterium sp. C1]|uniref:hypothetical protein n=1 Tax=Curtobacterium sp. C1 TaxID=2898151 RepID=UPI001E473761|nr:hypothetical protein [Curtobacterium sp. C1]UFU16094.1 hypothetical protein LQK89_17885 [Curtobacterium sp. C1]
MSCRRLTIALTAAATLVAALAGCSGTPNAAAPTGSASSGSARALNELAGTRMTTIGSEISVGLPATLTLDDVAGDTVYARVTMSELTTASTSELDALRSDSSNLQDVTTVYEQHVSLEVLGITDSDGTRIVPSTDALTAAVLRRFTIATHPGSDPLPTSNTLTTGSCKGIDGPSDVGAGSTVTWCIHAFATDQDSPPTGGSYQTSNGTYAVPLTWASKQYRAPSIP